ncbi:hypothetical protein HanIR_Chr13g0618051 [Helianthus annuus]|nr:hypothetical protein HanIR_Chr13g0618051 [Helianthus annuus]
MVIEKHEITLDHTIFSKQKNCIVWNTDSFNFRCTFVFIFWIYTHMYIVNF